MEKKEKIRSKNIGQVFTPQYLVEEMLDYAGYKNTAIIETYHRQQLRRRSVPTSRRKKILRRSTPCRKKQPRNKNTP